MSRKKCLLNENSLGGRLRLFREMNNHKLIPFAKLLGISHGSLSNIENNKTKPSADPLGALIHKTNINIYWLFTGEGNPFIDRSISKKVIEEVPISEMLSMTNTVLESETVYSETLAANIKSSFKALELERRTSTLEEKYDQLTKKLDGQMNRADTHGPEGQKGS